MRNLNHVLLATSLTAAVAVSCLTGCSMFQQQKSSERTEGRIVDDKKIASTVKTDLKNDPLYKFQDVEVRTFDGVVQLSGFVNSDPQKRRAEEIARQVPGVTEVQNALSLKPNNNMAPTGRTNSQNESYNNTTTTPIPATTAPPRSNTGTSTGNPNP